MGGQFAYAVQLASSASAVQNCAAAAA